MAPNEHDPQHEQTFKEWLANKPAGPVPTSVVGVYLLCSVVVACYWLIAIFPAPVTVRIYGAPAASSAPAGSAQRSLTPSDEPSPAKETAEPASEPVTMSSRWEFPQVSCFGHSFRLRPDQGALVLALLAGVLGSFVHAAQSLASYVGNREFRSSWILWYVLRPLIGAVLGLLFYFVVRAGLLSADAGSVSPYGIVAFGALAGWFSKQATDKLAEVFETMFRTEKAANLKDRLNAAPTPKIDKLTPEEAFSDSSAPLDLLVEGSNFLAGATLLVAGQKLPAVFVSDTKLTASLPPELLKTTGDLEVRVSNPVTPTGAAATQSAPKIITIKKTAPKPPSP